MNFISIIASTIQKPCTSPFCATNLAYMNPCPDQKETYNRLTANAKLIQSLQTHSEEKTIEVATQLV